MMAEASIPVDLTNPGQVFACLGFLEAADILLGDSRGGFDWRNPADLRFHLTARGGDNPFAGILSFLAEATVTTFAPARSSHNTNKWKIKTVEDGTGAFPFKDSGPDVLPACLSDSSGRSIVIDHWGDQGRTGRDRVKFWAGANGYPGAGLVRDALDLVRDALDLVRGRAIDHADDPFSLSAKQSSSFRFDWRRDYVPIDVGFSPNAHKSGMRMCGYPIVELLAAIGLTNARPVRRERLEYSYGVAGLAGDELYDPILLRAALGTEKPPFPGMPFRVFTMRLDWPGKEGQARCITDVIEEKPPS